jgi:Pyruvate/2-oxoacid:ferredoxin oxidoreductase gamma subunit
MVKKTRVIELADVVIKFAGDSGDGMQLTGTQFSETSALLGNDVATFPDYPSEIRAPQELWLVFLVLRFISDIKDIYTVVIWPMFGSHESGCPQGQYEMD